MKRDALWMSFVAVAWAFGSWAVRGVSRQVARLFSHRALPPAVAGNRLEGAWFDAHLDIDDELAALDAQERLQRRHLAIASGIVAALVLIGATLIQLAPVMSEPPEALNIDTGETAIVIAANEVPEDK